MRCINNLEAPKALGLLQNVRKSNRGKSHGKDVGPVIT